MNSRYYLTFKSTFTLKNQRNWLKQVKMLKFWNVINCVFVHWTKKLTLVNNLKVHSIYSFEPTSHCEKLYTWATSVLEHATAICLPAYSWLQKSWSFIHIYPRVYELCFRYNHYGRSYNNLVLAYIFSGLGYKKIVFTPHKKH